MSTQSGPPAAATGVIHDIGYRHYDGPRLGRAGIVRALGWHSLRSAFGIGRGAKAKIIPVIAFVIMCVPAVVNAIAMAQGGRPGGLLRHLRVPAPGPRHDHLRRGPGTRAGVPGPAQPRAAAVLLAAAAPARLPAGQARRVHPGLPGPAGDPAAAALPGRDQPGARRGGDLGPDQGADPGPARRAGLGRAAGHDRARARLAQRAPRVRDGQHRDLLLPQLGPGRAAARGARR